MANESKMVRRTVQALLLLVVALLTGCSQNAGKTESTGTDSQVLTFPVTITITTPSKVAPLAPVVGGSNLVSFGANSEVVQGITVSMGNGGIQTQPDALLKETWSRGTAALNDRVKVTTLHARTRTNGNNVSVTTWDQNPAIDPVQTLTWQVNYPSGPANPVTLNSGDSKILDPGKYGAVTANSGSTLTLRTGTYFLTTFSLQSSSIIKLDQARGPIVVYVTDSLPLRGVFQPLTGTNPDLLIAYLGTIPVVVETRFNGAVLAPSTSLTLRSVTGAHQGFYYAKDMILDAGAKVQFRAPGAIVGGSSPPGATCRKSALAAGVLPADLYKYCKHCEIPLDSDRDGFEDCVDDCKFDPLKQDPGTCGCMNPETDSDGDGTKDCLDPCDIDFNNVTPGECGCRSTDPHVKPPVAAGQACTTQGCPTSNVLTCNANGVCGNPSSCNPGGCRLIESNSSTYWLCAGPATQSAAATSCRNKQMALARIEGFLENDFLKQHVTAPVWIGANSITTSGNWRWATSTNNDGTQFWQGGATGSQRNALFSFWAKNAPGTQRCAVFQPETARWVDVDCNEGLGYLCEFRTPAKPSTPTTYPEPIGPRAVPTPIGPMCKTTANSFLPFDPNAPYDANDAGADFGIDNFRDAQNKAKMGQFIGPAQQQPLPNLQNCAEPPPVFELPAGIAAGVAATRDQRGCSFTVPVAAQNFTCKVDGDCTQFGSGLECREWLKPDCMPTSNPSSDPTLPPTTTKCGGVPRCGNILCAQPQVPMGDEPITSCNTVEVCDPGDEFDVANETTLVSEPFDPAKMFAAGLPVVQPSTAYLDDPDTTNPHKGKNHEWCVMKPQNDMPAADQTPDNRTGQSNGGSNKLKFSFDPNVSFKADVNPLSLGETDLDVRATASLTTRVKLNGFIGVDYEGDILSAVADIHAHRCRISTKDTKFKVFGLDFIELAGVPQFDTLDKDHDCLTPDASGDCTNSTPRFEPLTRDCNEAVDKFITASNRAKKAFRDVQQLVEQFKNVKQLSNGLGTLKDLCQNVIGNLGVDVPFFPDGIVCPANEPAEITINRFLDYYQAPGVGQIAQLRDTVREVADATNKFFNGLRKQYPFGPAPKNESKTLVQAQFQIGPVPCVLEVASFFSYGVNGFFEVGLKPPFNPFDDVDASKPQRNPVATVRAGVVPFANAGLSAFVGAGKSLGPFSATLGIEGKVSLADVRAPIFAGAGLGAEVMVDKRSLAPDIEATLDAVGLENVPTHLSVPKSFKFFIWYEYGAAITVDKVLSGEVNGRLRIKFAFFSRTWRKRIVKFNGLSGFTINIVNGKAGSDPTTAQDTDMVGPFVGEDKKPATETATVMAGTTDVGISESTVPLLALNPIDPPTDPSQSDPNAAGSREFDKTKVEGMFYDSLCCSKEGEACLGPGERMDQANGKAPCCPGSICRQDDTGSYVCSVDCKDPGGICQDSTDCCQASTFLTTCENNQCARCGQVFSNGTGAVCTSRNECCNAATDPLIQCQAGHCASVCLAKGTACTSDSQCCTNMNNQCSDTNQKCCGNIRQVVNNVIIPGATCTQNSDCCGADLGEGVVCSSGECMQGIS